MPLAIFPPLIVALAAVALVAWARKLRPAAKRWPLQTWVLLMLGGMVAAGVVRATEAIVIDVAVGGRLTGAEGVRTGLVAFGIVGPLTVLTLAALVWPVVNQVLRHEVDPPLAAAASAASFVVGRVIILLFIERVQMRNGVRAAILGIDDIALAATWGYGLSRSAFDGKLGGTPFGRYAVGTMIVRGAVEFGIRTRTPLGTAFNVAVGLLAGGAATMGILRLSNPQATAPASLASVGQETIREIARAQLRRGGVRPLWIVLGALGNLGGMIVGFATAVVIGRSARIDFGEIDRSGPAAEYAALLLVLGIVMSFPMSAAVVGLAGGGRNAPERPYVLEAGLAAMVALAALLLVVGVVAPVAVAVGIACAPVAFVLSGVGAWLAAGRRN